MTNRDIKLVDGEFNIVNKEIINQIQFLILKIEEYNTALSSITTTGIKDNYITLKINLLENRLNGFKADLNILSMNWRNFAKNYLNDFARLDKFKFPYSFSSIHIASSGITHGGGGGSRF